jgi:hypothetical protein
VKKLKAEYLLIIVGIIIAGFLFFWFFAKPGMIRKSCNNELESKYSSKGTVNINEMNNTYRICLVKNGMKPEDIVK